MSSEIEAHCGIPIYRSDREHIEYVGGTMYVVKDDDYFAAVHTKGKVDSFVSGPKDILITAKDMEEIKAQIDNCFLAESRFGRPLRAIIGE